MHRLIGEEEAFAIINRALELGVNLFNVGEGEMEESMGRWLALDSSRREKVILATFIGSSHVREKWPNQRGHSALYIRKACEASLRRLKTDYIDICQLDHIQRESPWEEIWQAMEQLVREGKVLYVGSANFAGWHIVQANEAARRRNFLGIVSEQSVYNLLQREIELEVIPACEAYGVGVFTWSSLCGGLLCGALKEATVGRRASKSAISFAKKYQEKLEAYENFCRELGETETRVALSWLLRNPVITAPIVGPRTVQQLEQAIHALDVHLPDVAISELDKIFGDFSTRSNMGVKIT